jgi:proteasome lid subunit RPN8/RPN11
VVVGIENELHSPVRYRMRAEGQLRGFRLLEEQGLDLLAIFHSHPAGPPVPSARDIAEAYYPEALTVICSPGADSWNLRGFWIEQGQVREEPIDD